MNSSSSSPRGRRHAVRWVACRLRWVVGPAYGPVLRSASRRASFGPRCAMGSLRWLRPPTRPLNPQADPSSLRSYGTPASGPYAPRPPSSLRSSDGRYAHGPTARELDFSGQAVRFRVSDQALYIAYMFGEGVFYVVG